MRLFEKVFNYQILSRLMNAGTFIVTSQERGWLKAMLQHPSARNAFSASTWAKLAAAMEQEQAEYYDIPAALTEKARSIEGPLFHPHLRPLRQAIAARTALRFAYRLKNGQARESEYAYPYKLEYSMVKKEWYLLWYRMRHRKIYRTKLHNIASFEAIPLPADRADQITADIAHQLARKVRTAAIAVIPTYNRELSRILYAFSCFEKEVEYDQQTNRYLIRLAFQSDDAEYVLSKLRFLGRRVKVVEGDELRSRMLESATRALARYGEIE
jgi:predicted DNA-binding transcriptional regulator YafY